jgi:predicted ATPase
MRLAELKLPEFKNLHDFSVSFDKKSSLSVLVGRNGAGKSNVLEALTVIFRDLDLGEPTSFPYELSYECRGRRVEINCLDRGVPTCRIDGASAPLARVQGEAGRLVRPDYVFGYYSGPSNRLEEHFRPHQERFYRDLVNGIDHPMRPLFYARAVHSNFVLLAFFLEDDARIQSFLADHLGIVDLDSVLFVMQRPGWKSRTGDPRFWNARGTVQALLDQLYRLSLAPLRLAGRTRVGLSRTTRTERLYLYLPDLRAVRDLAAGYDTNQDFFKALESTYISELIDDVRIRVEVRRAAQPLTFRELSEGEQQLLLVLGLIRFTREEESLFLLDEPDTHLNPGWSVQYREFLEMFGGLDKSSHVVLATHDPLVVASLVKEEVRILERGPAGTVVASQPWEDPRGMGVGALLTSDVYGLRSQLDLPTLHDLDRKRELSARPELTDPEIDELSALNARLAQLDLLAEDRDPEYQAFLRAKYELEPNPPDAVVLSRDEVSRHRALAEEILKEIELSDPHAVSPDVNDPD